VRHHGHEFASQLPQFLLSGQGPEQLGLGLLALGNVEGKNKKVWLAIDCDAFGRDQQRVNRASLAAGQDLDLAQRTVAALKIRPELRAVVQVYPHAQLY
jgi:hypothetical protein